LNPILVGDTFLYWGWTDDVIWNAGMNFRVRFEGWIVQHYSIFSYSLPQEKLELTIDSNQDTSFGQEFATMRKCGFRSSKADVSFICGTSGRFCLSRIGSSAMKWSADDLIKPENLGTDDRSARWIFPPIQWDHDWSDMMFFVLWSK